MKLIIAESVYKNIIFKFFTKFGGEIDSQFIDMFRLDSNNPILTYDEAYKYLIEWRGIEESKNLANTILLQNPHHIDDFGGYDFFFEVTDIKKWGLNDDEPFVTVKVKVDDLSGSVDIGGDHKTLEDALDNDDYGWQVEDEVNWGINDYFKEKITSKTGIKVIFFRPEYSSRTFNFKT
jgi:hypothetical protein